MVPVMVLDWPLARSAMANSSPRRRRAEQRRSVAEATRIQSVSALNT